MEEPKLTKKQEEALALLDRNLQLTREFMNDWLLFNQIITAYGAPGANKAELEAQFLKVKCKMARQHQVLKSALGADGKIDGNTMNIISTTTNLESIHAGSDIVIKKLESEWHKTFISLNQTLGGLEDKRARVMSGENVFVGMNAPKGLEAKGRMSEKTKKTIITLIIIAVVVGVLVGVAPIRNMYVNAFKDVFG